MTRRRKMKLSDLLALGISYHAFTKVRTRWGNRGVLYVLDKPLTAEQRAFVYRWENTSTGTAQSTCAPEIKYNTVTIWDKCLTVMDNVDPKQYPKTEV